MRPLFLLPVLSLACLASLAHADEQTRTVAAFNAIDIRGPISMEVESGKEQSLLLREDHEVRRVVLPLWGGDGTRGITLYLRTEARWARFPPAQLPVFRPIDFQTLPVPKLLTEQEREAATVANDMPSNIR